MTLMATKVLTEHSQLASDQRALLDRWRKGLAAQGDRVIAGSRRTEFPLSSSQERLWFLQQTFPNSVAYHVTDVFSVEGPLDTAALSAAVNCVVQRHDVLRSRIANVDGDPRQIVVPDISFAPETVDCSGWNEQEQSAAVQALAHELSGTPFRLDQPPLIRAKIIRRSSARHTVIVTVHHIICDGWSIGILFNEVVAHYLRLTGGPVGTLPPLGVQ